MNATQLQLREKAKEHLLAFVKTLAQPINDNQWGTVMLRLENCTATVRMIVEMETEEIVK